MTNIRIIEDVVAERARQEELKAAGKFLWSCSDDIFRVVHDNGRSEASWYSVSKSDKMAVLSEEVGEASKEVVDYIIQGNKGNTGQQHVHLVNLRKELVQVAAVCVAWLESLDREIDKFDP